MRYFAAVAIAVTAVALSSCSFALEALLYNNTPTDVVVWKVHEKSSVSAAPGAMVEFKLQAEQHIDFGQDAFVYEPKELKATEFISEGRIKLQAEKDGKLYIVPPSAVFPVSPLPAQPPGFPLTPSKHVDLT
jgi:hypothetical protein